MGSTYVPRVLVGGCLKIASTATRSFRLTTCWLPGCLMACLLVLCEALREQNILCRCAVLQRSENRRNMGSSSATNKSSTDRPGEISLGGDPMASCYPRGHTTTSMEKLNRQDIHPPGLCPQLTVCLSPLLSFTAFVDPVVVWPDNVTHCQLAYARSYAQQSSIFIYPNTSKDWDNRRRTRQVRTFVTRSF